MPVPSNNATASSVNGTLVATRLLLGPNDHQARLVVSGTYTGLQGTLDVSMDGTTWINHNAVQEDTGVVVNGTLNPSAANLSYVADVTGWLYVRFNCTACASGTAVQTLFAAGALTGTQPIIANTTSITSFTSGTFSTTLAVTGASTLTGNTTVGGTFGVTGATTLSSTLSAGGKIFPATDDGAALGDTTHNFSDLFLATGAVINIANANWAATHSSGILTVGTGDLRVTTAGTNTASVVTVGGTQTLAAKTFTTPVIGVATGTSLAVTGLITTSSPTAAFGYATGAGGAVAQATDRTTGVTINTNCGAITTQATSLAAGAEVSFTVTNSACAVGDVVVAAIRSGPTTLGSTQVAVTTVAAGSFQLTLNNLHASVADTGAAIINFAIIKAVSA